MNRPEQTRAPLVFNWQHSPSNPYVLALWSVLEKRTENANLFLSSGWIGNWITSFGKPDWLLTITDGDQPVAGGVWYERYHKRPLGFHVSTLHLNMTGNPECDQVWPEYNGLLCLPGYEAEVYRRLPGELFQQHQGIDEIDLGLAVERVLKALPETGFVQDILLSDTAYQYVPERGALGQGSKSLTGVLNRTKRALTEQGEWRVECLSEADDALAAFEAMKPAHTQRWGQSSGFNNPSFMAFHRDLIRQQPAGVKARVIRLMADKQCLAAHYCLQYRQRLSFYLGVTAKPDDNKCRPGYLLHADTIERMKAWGVNEYDFMAGTLRYKQQFANQQQLLARLRLKRPTVAFKLERQLKRLKAKATESRTGSQYA